MWAQLPGPAKDRNTAAHLCVVHIRSLNTRKQVCYYAIEKRKVSRSQLGDVHVLHGQQDHLTKYTFIPSTNSKL